MAARDGLGQHAGRKESSQMTRRLEEEEWETEEAEASKTVGTVISVRFPRVLAERIFDLAERRGTPVSSVVREAIEEYLAAPGAVPATTDITVSGEGSVTLVTGHSAGRRTIGTPTDFVDQGEQQLALT